MNWLGSIILWEVSNLTLVVLGSSLWKITQMGVSWRFKFSVRLVLCPTGSLPVQRLSLRQQGY
jgi:hypothetical protein